MCDAVELAATVRAECHFERKYIGRWMLFDDDADVESKFDVSSGEVRSSTLGSFICKGKHWQLPYYKVLSVFDNSWYVYLHTFVDLSFPRLFVVVITTTNYANQICLSLSSTNVTDR